jgi:hypothetical protein
MYKGVDIFVIYRAQLTPSITTVKVVYGIVIIDKKLQICM